MDKDQLIFELNKALVDLNELIDFVKKSAELKSLNPYSLMDTQGNPLLAPLVTAQANALAALANLQD